MEIKTADLVRMIRGILQGKVIPQDKLAELTVKCAKLYGANSSEAELLIKEVECEISFQLEDGRLIK